MRCRVDKCINLINDVLYRHIEPMESNYAVITLELIKTSDVFSGIFSPRVSLFILKYQFGLQLHVIVIMRHCRVQHIDPCVYGAKEEQLNIIGASSITLRTEPCLQPPPVALSLGIHVGGTHQGYSSSAFLIRQLPFL